MNQQAIEILENQRLELEKLYRALGSAQDHLDRGHPSPEEQKKIMAVLSEKQRLLAELEKQYKNHLQTLRYTDPATMTAWVNQHLAVIEAIINDSQNAKPPLTEKDLKVRLHVARKTTDEWQQVLAGTRDYVHINDSFMPDYGQRLQDGRQRKI